MKRHGFIFLTMIGLLSCEKPYRGDVYWQDTGLIAVEAILTNENVPHQIRLSIPSPLNGDPAQPLSDAYVVITQGDSVFEATESAETPGIYMTDAFRAVSGRRYTLTILYDGKEFSGSDESVAVEPLSPIAVRQAGELFQLEMFEAGQDPNYVDHLLSWKETDHCATGSCEARIVFYDLKTIDVNEIYQPSQHEFFFPEGTTIIRRKYSVSNEYRAFLRSMLIETQWRGGVFDVQRANLPTNMSEGAVGFFAVATVVSDTTVIE